MIDNTTEFIKGVLLAYCQVKEPVEIGMLFDDVFLMLDREKAADISAAIVARYFVLALNVREDNNE